MFIKHLYCSWWKHPFVTNSFLIKDEAVIAKIIKAGIQEVDIDTELSHVEPKASMETEVKKEMQKRIKPIAENKPKKDTQAALSDELTGAKIIATEAQKVIHQVKPDTQLGQPINMEEVNKSKNDTQAALSDEPAGAKIIETEAQKVIQHIISDTRPGQSIKMEAEKKPKEDSQAALSYEPTGAKIIETEAQKVIHQVMSDTRLGQPIKMKAEKKPEKDTWAALSYELAEANLISTEAQKVIHQVMSEVRFGQSVKMEAVKNVVEEITDSVFRNQDALIYLSRIKQKDTYTFQHSVSVCVLMISFSKEINIDRETINWIGIGALLHDIGKMMIPLEILNKPGTLTEDEFNKMKEHVALGTKTLSQTPGMDPSAIRMVAEHHERLDGRGYPEGLEGESISLFGQMVAITDVYDAMTSDRVYRQAVSPSEVLKNFLAWSKVQFKEELVQRFIKTVGIYPVGTLVRLGNDHLALVTAQGRKDLLHPVVLVVYDAKKKYYLLPYKIDLSGSASEEKILSIVGHESLAKWNINPNDFL